VDNGDQTKDKAKAWKNKVEALRRKNEMEKAA
jgi:hypothetical protein